MLIPHNSVKPVKITFPLSFLLFMVLSWTGVTMWAGYLANRHLDYWKIQADHKLMKLKVIFFAQQVKKSQEMLEQVKSNDEQLRNLLEMKSKKAIIENNGKGGPTNVEVGDLNRLLVGKIHEMTEQDIYRQTVSLQEESKRRIESYNKILNYIDDERTLYRATPNIWPCSGHVTSNFGFRIHPMYYSNEFHSGLDIANRKNTPICATADGTIRFCEWQPGFGRLIILDHKCGYRTYYGHLEKILVKKGDFIRRGQLVGLMGSTGTSTGSHLHYEVQYNGRATNPGRFLKNTYLPTAKLLN